MAQKPALGKGLASLLPQAAQTSATVSSAVLGGTKTVPSFSGGSGAELAGSPVAIESLEKKSVGTLQTTSGATSVTTNKDRHPGIAFVSVEEIHANNYQPRHSFDEAALLELSQSIKENGVIQPLVVRKDDKGYQLIAGERRLRAAKLAGLKQVPIVIKKSTDKEALELAIVENIQRQDLNCIDEALAYLQLTEEFGLTQEEVAKKVGKDRASVSNLMRLLRLPDAIIDDLRRGIISLGHGKVLLGVDDPEIKLQVRAAIVSKKLSIRETEQLILKLKEGAAVESLSKEKEPSIDPVLQRLKNIETELKRKHSLKVEIKGNGVDGKIVFHYHTKEDLEKLLTLINS